MPSKQPKPFARFDFDLVDAVLSKLIATFDALPIRPLTAKMLSQIHPEQGVYMVYLTGKILYVGRTADSLPKQLGEHLKELAHRKDVNVRDLGFKCVIIPPSWMAYIDLKAFTANYHWQLIGVRHKKGSRI